MFAESSIAEAATGEHVLDGANCSKNTLLHFLAKGVATGPVGGHQAVETRCLICM